ncbi:MAG: PilZ domain-containing protein [Nitrospirae bacterium]|nr:PilZ domain-containing protein [Nitrospirota bacterium]
MIRNRVVKTVEMEKRRSQRKPVSLDAEVSFDGKNYPVYIENISEYGLHVIAAAGKKAVSIVPEMILKLEFQPPAGEKTDLHYEVRWVHINKTPIHGLTYRMGMDISDQFSGHKDLLNILE